MAKKEAETPMTNADILAEVNAILAQAKAEAQAIIDSAKKSVGEMTDEEKAEKKAEEEAYIAYMNELVPVRLFKDSGRYSDDVFLSINGENCRIKRGEKVMIKRKFAIALDRIDDQRMAVAEMIEGEKRKYQKAVDDRAL